MERHRIAVAPLKEKLNNLANHTKLAKDDEFLQRLGRFIASRLGDRDTVYAEGLNLVMVLALADLQSGVSGFPSQPLPHALTGQPPMLYATLEAMILPRIFEELLSSEDAAAFKEVRAAVDKLARSNV